MGDWRKSTYSSANGGDCVEAASTDGVILVRDTANRTARSSPSPLRRGRPRSFPEIASFTDSRVARSIQVEFFSPRRSANSCLPGDRLTP